MDVRWAWGVAVAAALGAGCSRPCEDTGDCPTVAVPLEFRAVTVGQGFSCGLASAQGVDDVGILCWGANVLAARPPSGVAFDEIAAGDRHACGIDRDRGVHCWGERDLPQTEEPLGPGGNSYQFLSVSPTHNCAIAGATRPRCWGADVGTSVEPPPDLDIFYALAAGHGHTCTLEFATRLPACWGRDDAGQSSAPAVELHQVAAGDGYSCALTVDGERVCWGRSLADEPPPSARFRTLAAAGAYACGLDLAGQITCWGDTVGGLASPPTDAAFEHLAVGREHACAITQSTDLEPIPRVRCWGGDNASGQLDAPTTIDVPVAEE